MPAVPGQMKVREVLDPDAEMEVVKDAAAEALRSIFPIVGRKHELRLENVRVEDDKDKQDFRGQLDAKINERTWGVPLNATMVLADRQTGKVLDRRDMRLAELPKLTPRLSYLVNGQEYQLDKQWRLKPGIYARVKDNGELESHVNVAGGERFAITFEPTSRRFTFDHAGSTIPLFPLLRAMGVDDTALRSHWGREIYDANATEKYEGALRKFYRVDTGKDAPSLDVAVQHLRQTLGSKELSPDVTEHTLGQRIDHLTGNAMALASKNLLEIARGNREPDDRDAILFKNLYSTEDYVAEKLRIFGTAARRRLINTVDRHQDLKQLVYPGMFDRAVSSVFTDSTVSRIPTQDNPVEMLEGFGRTTIIGPGAIGDTRMVTEEAKAVDKSHLGFLDPIDTPEGEKVGISAHLALGVSKKGLELYTPVYDVANKRMVPINTAEFYRSNVALPDSVRWVSRGGTKIPEPVGKTVKIVGPGNDVQDAPWSSVKYVVPNAGMLMGMGTNLVPFAQNNSGNRLSMSARHLAQTVPLKAREVPLVQSVTSGDLPFDRLPGALAAFRAKHDGVVTKIERGAIHYKNDKGETTIQQIYDYFPLNDRHSGVHAEPVVKVGDRVKSGQLLADSWYSKDGMLAIGTNLRSISGSSSIFWVNSNGVTRSPIATVCMDSSARSYSYGCASRSPELLPVRAYLAHPTTESMVEVETNTGRRVRVTENHSLVTLSDDGQLAEMKPADVVVGETYLPRLGHIRLPVRRCAIVAASIRRSVAITLNSDFGWLLGFYLAEGWCNPLPDTPSAKARIFGSRKGKHPNVVGFAVMDPTLKARLYDVLHRILPGVGTYEPPRSVIVNSAALANHLLDFAGSGAFRKHLPNYVWESPVEFRRAILAGYWDGDGTVTKKDRKSSGDVCVPSVSKDLAEGIADLCTTLGISTTLQFHPAYDVYHAPSKKMIHCSDQYWVRVANHSLQEFPDLFCPHKRQRLQYLRTRCSEHSFTDTDMIPIRGKLRDSLTLFIEYHCPAYVRRQLYMVRRGYADRMWLRRVLALSTDTDIWLDRLRAIVAAPVYWDLVTAVRPSGYEDVVYDLDMGENPNFALSNGLVVHNTAFIATPIFTHEDSVVISESAAKRLTSLHLHRHQFVLDEDTRVGRSTFAAYYPDRYGQTQLDKLDVDGVVREGQVVHPGDPLTLGLHQQQYTTEARAIAKLRKSLVKPYADISTTWDQDVPGRVVRVHKLPDGRAHVFVAAEEPAQIADKISTRSAFKGTIGQILPDDQMPRDKAGKPMDVLLNPYSIPGRQVVGQVYEMAAGKIALKTGKPYLTRNYQPDVDYGEQLRAELKAHGVDEQEELFDPTTGALLGKALVGPVYTLKQRHQVDRKIHARAGGPGYAYDVDRQPRRGGEEGAQSLGGLGELALLAHGARNILREAHTYKSDLSQQDELWRAMQMGQPIPPPKATFAQKKFESYLNVLGVRLKKDGTRVQMVPLTDHEVLRMSSGELKHPNLTLKGHALAPEDGGLFDERTAGGLDGEHMTHIRLPEAIPNPFFERGVSALTGLTQDQLLDVLGGRLAIDADGHPVPPRTSGARTGSIAVGWLLDRVDVKGGMKELQQQLPKLTGVQLDRANRKLRYLEALNEHGLSPRAAYMTTVVPVLPPNMRPLTVLPSGDLATDPLNETYKALGTVVAKYNDMDPALPERSKGRLRKELYTSLAALQGVGAGYKRIQGGETQGIMDVFTQPTAKHAWIFQHLFKPRQDLSARSVITPDPNVTIDEIGVPHRIATEIFKPFTIRELSRSGYSPLQAEQLIKKNDPMAEAMLSKVMETQLVLMKRDPVLHKYGIQAFKPVLRKGLSITINPMVAAGFGADFDGDATALFVPQTTAAQHEARKMLPSSNLLHPATGRPVYAPTNEMQLGLFRSTTIQPTANAPEYQTVEQALAAAAAGKQKWGTIKVGGRATTMGRVRLWATLPVGMRQVQAEKILYDPQFVWNSKRTEDILHSLAAEHAPEYAGTVQKLMDIGARNVYEQAFSLSLQDFKADRGSREAAFSTARAELKNVDTKLSPQDHDAKVVDIWVRAGEQMEKEHWDKIAKNPPQLAQMALAGIKPSRDQYKQLVLAPMIVAGIKGRPIPNPVARSFSEGLDTASFWTQAQAARVASMRKTQEVREPGYLSKQIINTVADVVIAARDCGTTEGIALSIDHPDVVDRYLAKPASGGGVHLDAGTMLTPELTAKLRAAGQQSVIVRSPLKCKLPQGVCQRCAGISGDGHLPEIGTNVGVIAGQALGERSTQLMLRSVHTGGVVNRGAGNAAVNQFDRIEQLLRMPKVIPNAAVLAESPGVVKSVRPDPAGGHRVVVDAGGSRLVEHHVPGTVKLAPGIQPGERVSAGMPLSAGNINVHDLLRTAGLPAVQNQITNELDDIYRPQGIRRRNVEIIVRGVTNLGHVEDPGGNDTLRRGDMIPLSVVHGWNEQHKEHTKVTPVLKGIAYAPLDLTEDWLSKLHHERLKETLVDAALQGHRSNISGYNPFASLVFNPQFGQGLSGIPGAY